MPKYGPQSRKNLETAHPLLKLIFNQVIEEFDCSITCGHRNEVDQNKAFSEGNSKVQWPSGKHNKLPSEAIDAHPWPVDWDDLHRFYYFAGRVMQKASDLGIKLRWGGDWDSDTEVSDNKFNDLVHFELDSAMLDSQR